MNDGRPVAQVLSPVIAQILGLTLAMASVAILGGFLANQSVRYLSEELQPAASANQDILADLSDARGATREWVVGGRPSARADYREAEERLATDLATVSELTTDDPGLERLLVRQERAVRAWLEDYGAVVISRPGGTGQFDRQLFATGLTLFEDFRQIHDDTTAAYQFRVSQANEASSRRLGATVAAVVLLALLEALVIVRARRRLTAEIAEPLRDLEAVVHQMADGHGVRAVAEGPREVREVAGALNDLADAQARARQVEDRIQQEQRALDVAQDDFVSNVSHELRTPLTTISGYLELVADEFEESMAPHHLRMLTATRRNVARLQLLVDDLLTLSKAEASSTSLEALDLATVIRPVVTDVQLGATRRGIALDVALPEEELLVLGDRVMLHRALLNLLSNAVKFSRRDGVVEVELTRDGRQAAIAVRDHGIGIPQEEIDLLGTRFFRASNAVSKDIGGSGLGLRIVQTILEKHTGSMMVESKVGEGTTVTIRLPLQSGPGRET
ncbi:ATP-binding protein [Nocardioides sp.]|uniref:sensor histidine kinase n=1 Tax=Nocardioides sp. TaxID=35761 RepID=UPI002D80F324|nr:ATP-binding protein [Nocardioides sp.]HET8961484.1 ATP-binding protein [Nocardioides sp.]